MRGDLGDDACATFFRLESFSSNSISDKPVFRFGIVWLIGKLHTPCFVMTPGEAGRLSDAVGSDRHKTTQALVLDVSIWSCRDWLSSVFFFRDAQNRIRSSTSNYLGSQSYRCISRYISFRKQYVKCLNTCQDLSLPSTRSIIIRYTWSFSLRES